MIRQSSVKSVLSRVARSSTSVIPGRSSGWRRWKNVSNRGGAPSGSKPSTRKHSSDQYLISPLAGVHAQLPRGLRLPAPAEQLALRAPGVFGPSGAKVIARAVRRGGPHQLRQRLGQAAPALLALAQCLFCDAALVVHRASRVVALL